jgi:hypothetical protein
MSYSKKHGGRYGRRVLISICGGTKERKTAHIPRRYFTKRFQNDKHQKKEDERALRSFIARGYMRMHPTHGEMTYELTDDGLAFCHEIARRPA